MKILQTKFNFLFVLLLLSCSSKNSVEEVNRFQNVEVKLKNYNSLADRQAMVLGTFHFNKETLTPTNQKSIEELAELIKSYNPTKILVEWEPKLSEKANERYHQFLMDSFDISDKHNEVFQLGFRLAKKLNHDSIYLFDDQTEYIGSLNEFSTANDPFSFDLFGQYAEANDAGFYDTFLDTIMESYEHNQSVLDSLSLKDRIIMLNAPLWQENNAKRMHMFEMRVGIQKNWAGPDWVGRWYRRNVRMTSNALKISEKGDRLLLIVGDNHKWTLDMLLENTPDFQLISSWNLLTKVVNE